MTGDPILDSPWEPWFSQSAIHSPDIIVPKKKRNQHQSTNNQCHMYSALGSCPRLVDPFEILTIQPFRIPSSITRTHTSSVAPSLLILFVICSLSLNPISSFCFSPRKRYPRAIFGPSPRISHTRAVTQGPSTFPNPSINTHHSVLLRLPISLNSSRVAPRTRYGDGRQVAPGC